MRFAHRDGTVIHVGYCTNVHPAESLAGVLDQLRTYAGPVRRRLGVARLGVGLWLSRSVVDEVLIEGTGRLEHALADLGLEVVTLNGFPYGGFHADEVKYDVYRPDWTDVERLRYTLDLASILARLLPPDAQRGSVSTLPLMWRTSYDDSSSRSSSILIDKLAEGLALVAHETGREIRVAFEPEPGCVVEDAAGAARHLVPGAALGVCFDACHVAVQFDDPAQAVALLIDAGLPIVKLQASCALEAGAGAHDALTAYVEARYLHQVRSRTESVDDLPEALDSMDRGQDWRVHYHVPIDAAVAAPLRTTKADLVDTLRVMFGGDTALTDHVEVETYTWGVLPGAAATDLVGGLTSELAWLRDQLLALGCTMLESQSLSTEEEEWVDLAPSSHST